MNRAWNATPLLAALLLASCAGGGPIDVHFWDPDSPVLPLLTRAEEAPAESEPIFSQYVILLPEADGTVGEVDVSAGGETTHLTEAYQAVRFDALGDTYVIEPREVEEEFEAAVTHEPEAPASFTLYFGVGSTALTTESLAAAAAMVAATTRRPAPEVWVEGHGDRSGSAEENIRISKARAEAVRDLLVTAGLAPDIIETAWHGESRPAVATPDGVAEPRNRRVEIRVR